MPQNDSDIGKNLLIQILNSALEVHDNHDDYQKIAFDNSELKAFLTNFISSNEAIIHLSDEMLNILTSATEDTEEYRAFFADIKFIKGIVEIYKETNSKLEFDNPQQLNLRKLRELIERVISKNETKLKKLQRKSEKQLNEYQRILDVINSNELITATDYDTIEEVVRSESPAELDANFNIIMRFLNERNAPLLEKIYHGQAEDIAVQIIPEVEQSPIIESSPKTTEAPVQETGMALLEKNQKLKEIMAYLRHDFDRLDEHLKDKLRTVSDLKALEEFAYYLREENKVVYDKLIYTNKDSLVDILVNSSKDIINSVLETLNADHNIKAAGGELFRIVNYCTRIFAPEGYENFIKNSKLFAKYKIPIRTLIKRNISFMITNNEGLEKAIQKLEEYNADIGNVLEKCSTSLEGNRHFEDGTSLIERNLKIMELYGFDLNAFFTDNASCFTILCSSELDTKLDQFIEVGTNEYIHNSPSLTGSNFKALIIKTIYYAFKNNLQVWKSEKTVQKQLSNRVTGLRKSADVYPSEVVEDNVPEVNQEMETKIQEFIANSNYLATDEDIIDLKNQYAILEQIDEGYRPALYPDTSISKLRRTTELTFGTQIISRRKVFRVFKILIEKGVDIQIALLYALTYNTILEPSEFDFIKTEIDRLGAGHNDRLLKSV